MHILWVPSCHGHHYYLRRMTRQQLTGGVWAPLLYGFFKGSTLRALLSLGVAPLLPIDSTIFFCMWSLIRNLFSIWKQFDSLAWCNASELHYISASRYVVTRSLQASSCACSSEWKLYLCSLTLSTCLDLKLWSGLTFCSSYLFD